LFIEIIYGFSSYSNKYAQRLYLQLASGAMRGGRVIKNQHPAPQHRHPQQRPQHHRQHHQIYHALS